MILANASIKKKLEAIILFTAAAVLLLNFLLFMTGGIISAREDSEIRLGTLATVLGANTSAAITYHDQEATAEILATLSSQEDVLWAGILVNGEILAEYRSEDFTSKSNNDSFLFCQINVKKPILFDKEHIGDFHIMGDMSRAQAVLIQQAYLGLGIFIISMMFALLLSSRLQRIISVPVQRLLDTMKHVAHKRDYSRRAIQVSNDELGTLVDGFNSMLEEIQNYDEKLTVYSQELERLVIERTRELETAKNEAEAANQIKSNFITTMSHEIRTPMNGVVGYTSLLQKTDLNTTQQEYVHNISSSSDHLLSIINDILDFSKIEADKLNLEDRDFNLDTLIQDLQSLFESTAQNKGIELQTKIDEDVYRIWHGDSLRLSQILINLMSNAIKFTQQGQVTVHIKNSAHFNPQTGLQITVSDTGIGITAEQREVLFQPFQQADSSITRRFGGTGLGLAITQRLVSLMGGEITLTSEPGQGSCFSILIPLEATENQLTTGAFRNTPDADNKLSQATQSEEQINIIASTLNNLDILVVDDNAINLKVATTLLASKGANVIAASSGVEALNLIARNRFAIILMDLEMPDMSGIDTTLEIRQSRSYAEKTPIIALTAHAFSEIRLKVIEAGMNDLLAKPYKPEQLYSIIVKWCGVPDSQIQPEAETVEKHETLQAYDRAAALAIVAGNEVAAEQLLNDFLKELPDYENSIRAAHKIDDHTALYDVIHKLSGSASSVGALAIHNITQQLQNNLKLKPTEMDNINKDIADLLEQISCFKALFKNN